MNEPSKRTPGRRKTGKVNAIFRLSPETRARLDRAVEQFNLPTVSGYAEQAILDKLRKDKVE